MELTAEERLSKLVELMLIHQGKENDFVMSTPKEFESMLRPALEQIQTITLDPADEAGKFCDTITTWLAASGMVIGRIYREDDAESYWISTRFRK